jgi:alkanesulfonate monooxygenase SsuD/methylene tetrahydromethanopterin reductase-like flavin-dependent oxidoreductase (luciferase family)
MHIGMASGFANHAKIDDARFMREEMALAMFGEELGFDSFWLTEHHFSDYSLSPNPLTFLSWLAGRTKRIRLGTQVLVVPWHDPVRITEQIVLLDHLSGGRAIIGFGRGLARSEYEGFRIPQAEARERFDETVGMVMRALETGYLEGDGKIFQQPRREIRPRPLRSLNGRAFAAVGTAASAISAAKLGLGRLYLNQPMVFNSKTKDKDTAVHSTPPTATTEGDPWLAAWHEAHPGTVPPKPFMSNLVFVDESGERARELARKYVAITFHAAIKHYELMSESLGKAKGYEAYEAMRIKPEDVEKATEGNVAMAIAGTPKEVLERFAKVKRDVDPQGMMPHFHTGGMPFEEASRNMRYFAKHCLPELKSWPAAESTIGEPLPVAA